jgi:hypothetical protein
MLPTDAYWVVLTTLQTPDPNPLMPPNVAASNSRHYTLRKCVGLSGTSAALKRPLFYWMGCVALNIEAMIQPVSPL